MRQEETKQFGESGPKSSPKILSIFYDCENRFVGRGYIHSRSDELAFMKGPKNYFLECASIESPYSKKYKKAGLAAFDVPVFVEVDHGE